MSSNETTTISVQKETRERLWEHKESSSDTYDDALQRVLSRVSEEN